MAQSKQVTQLIKKLENLGDTTNQYLDEHMEEWYNLYVIAEIKRIARAMNLPQAFIDGVEFVKTAPNEGKVINTWGTFVKPLAKWFNNGTWEHWIAPVVAKALSWITLLGRRVFSKGHMVSGLMKAQAMEIGITVGERELRQVALSQTNEYLKGVAEE